MKKTLNDLTPEIKAKIPIYKEKCIKNLYNGEEHKKWKRKDATDYIEYVYKLGKQKDKPVIVVANNILQYKMYYNLLFNTKMNKKYVKLVNLIWFLKNKKKIVKKQLHSKLSSELDSELGFKLRSELGSELRSELRSELYSELHSELDSELGSELRFELDSELDSELYSKLSSELDSELGFKLRSELGSELRSELRSELGSELDSELDSELYSELDSELYSELYSELDSELDSELRSELHSELNSELEIVKYHWLFLTNEYSRLYLMWYKFIQDEFNLKCKKSKELNWLYEHSLNGIAKCFLCKKIVLVLRMPEKINRNEQFLHCSTNEGAIVYSNQKLHYLNGRKVENWIFDKYFDKTLTFKDFSNCKNEEDKASIITLIKENEGNEGVLNFLNATLIDEKTFIHADGYNDVQKLYKSKEKFNFAKDSKGNTDVCLAWHEMKCASTGQSYLIETCPTFKNVEDSSKFLRPKSIPTSVPYIWQSCN